MTTTNFSWPLPTVGASADTWGTTLNDTIELIDIQVKGVQDSIPLLPDLSPYALLSGGTFTGGITAPSFTGNLTGNADTSSAWVTARTLTLTGPVTGSIGIDGSQDGALTTSIENNALTISMTTGLQAALDAKEPALNASQKRAITFGTAAPTGTPADGDIYLEHE